MGKIKPLLPSLKEKKRYLAFEVISKEKEDFSEVSKAIWSSMKGFMGELGLAGAGAWVLQEKYNAQTQKGLIRINHKYVNELKASLCFINKIGEQDVIVRSLGISGILNKAEKKYLG